jgi:hypothetical protein
MLQMLLASTERYGQYSFDARAHVSVTVPYTLSVTLRRGRRHTHLDSHSVSPRCLRGDFWPGKVNEEWTFGKAIHEKYTRRGRRISRRQAGLHGADAGRRSRPLPFDPGPFRPTRNARKPLPILPVYTARVLSRLVAGGQGTNACGSLAGGLGPAGTSGLPTERQSIGDVGGGSAPLRLDTWARARTVGVRIAGAMPVDPAARATQTRRFQT